jgi:hypothetical protein
MHYALTDTDELVFDNGLRSVLSRSMK